MTLVLHHANAKLENTILRKIFAVLRYMILKMKSVFVKLELIMMLKILVVNHKLVLTVLPQKPGTIN